MRERPRGASSAPPRGGPAQPSAPAGTTAILFATAATDEGGPAAALAFEDGTLLSRLIEQYESLGVRDLHVVTRPAFEEALKPSAGSARLRVSADVPSDLRIVAETAASARGAVVVGLGDILTHRQALAGLLADPRTSTGILATAAGLGRPFSPRTRSSRGRVVSAASAYHVVHRPNHRFLGVLRVAPASRESVAEVAQRLAELTTPPLLDGWQEELDAKTGRWRLRLASRELAAAEGDGAESAEEPPDEPDLEPEPLAPETPEQVLLSPEMEQEIARRRAAAPEDVTALLLVGLVRSGVHVGSSFVRKLYWARPLSEFGVARAGEKLAEYDEDRVLLDSAVKAQDGFFTTHFVSPYSKYIARWAARRGFTPNQVTTVSVMIGFVAAAAFATGERWGLIAGAILLQAAFTTDCVDGQLARYTRTFTKLGAWLDSIFDRTKEYAVFAGLAIGASQMGDPVWVLAGAALTLQSVRHSMDFSFAAAQHQVIAAAPQEPLESSADRPVRTVQPAARSPQPAGTASLPAEPREPFSLRRLPSLALAVWRRLDKLPGVLWLKRIVAFPIGERFAAISITAAFFTPRTTFVVLLAWGGFAAMYSTTGRLLRTLR